MRRSLLLFVVVGLVLAACGGQAQPAATPTTVPSDPVGDNAVQAPGALGQQANTQPDAPKQQAVLLKDYVDSDPALVGQAGHVQMIEFFAHWCDVCQGMRPMIHELEDKYGDHIDFIYLNIDAANTKDLQQKLGFIGLRPTIIFINSSGTEQGRLMGQHTKEEISKQLDSLMAVGG